MSQRARPLHEHFEDQVAARPLDRAIGTDEGGWISFMALDSAANAVATELVRRGIEPQARVGIRVLRSAASIAAVLGVWKAGATYVPIDPFAPVEHTAFVLRQASVALVITTAN